MIDWLLSLDVNVLLFVNKTFANDFFDWFFPSITDLYKEAWFQALAIGLSITGFGYKFKWKGAFAFLVFAMAIGTADLIGGQILKKFVDRKRPGDSGIEVTIRSPYGGKSFPSNHASNMFCAASFLGRTFPPMREVFYFAAIAVGYSRVYNGVHFPSDVLFGALWGYFWGLLWFKIFQRLFFRELYKEQEHG